MISEESVNELIQAADRLHERCSDNDRIMKGDAWQELGRLLDRLKPIGFWRNTGESRVQDVPLPMS